MHITIAKPYACIQACAKYKRNMTRSVFALSVLFDSSCARHRCVL
nr:MAG TPA: hypothetical protein [Caudoviricetes sp.]